LFPVLSECAYRVGPGATFSLWLPRWACLLAVGRRGDCPDVHPHWKILLNVGVEPPCRVPTKGESKKVQRQKLNETGVRYSFLLRAHFTFSQVLMFSRSF
jgi:hypothetical protein